MAIKPENIKLDLIDHNEQSFTTAQLKTRLSLVYFGFLHCRAVCPRSLAKLDSILNHLGSSRDRFRVLYITVDPERDTPTAMKAFLSENYPSFIGLSGNQDAVDEAKESMKVFTRRTDDPEDPEGYSVPHTALIYLINEDGQYLTHFADHLSAETIAEQLQSYI